jgi:hypothetical protein
MSEKYPRRNAQIANEFINRSEFKRPFKLYADAAEKCAKSRGLKSRATLDPISNDF